MAEYVEYKASGKAEAGEPLSPGFAPKAVRESGYAAGRWTAVLLDRFVPGWQDDIEAGRAAYPEDILDGFLMTRTGRAAFTGEESASFSEQARAALSGKAAERKRILESLNEKGGASIVINARRRPLHFESFSPFAIEAIVPGVLVHTQGFLLKNENGIINLYGRPALTELDGRGRVVRVVIPGVPARVRFRPGQRTLFYRTEEIQFDLKSVRVRSQGNIRYIIDLG